MWRVDQQHQGWHKTAHFNSSLLGLWMHSSSGPPAADWMGQNSVCHGVTLPFPERSKWNHGLLFSGRRQGCHCEPLKFLLTPGLLLTPASLRSPSSSVCLACSFKVSNASILPVILRFHSRIKLTCIGCSTITLNSALKHGQKTHINPKIIRHTASTSSEFAH